MMSESVLALVVLSWLAGAARAQFTRERPRCLSADCTDPEIEDRRAIFRLYGNIQVSVEFKENEKFVMDCFSPLEADDAALPAMPRPVTVDRASINGCRAPRSYAAALAALNVTAAGLLTLSLLPGEPSLESYHLAILTVGALIIDSSYQDVNANLTGLFLAGLELRRLDLISVTLSPDMLNMLPDSLEHLKLNVAFEMTEPLSLHWMTRLTSLRTLKIVAVHSEKVAPVTPPSLSRFPGLTEISLNMPLSLPRNWLNGSALTTLSLNNCCLTELHEDMFLGVNLTTLNLIGKKLTELSERVFSPLRWLTRLDVSNNSLRGAALWRAAAPLPALASLRADGNPLGAACPDDQGLSAPNTLLSLELVATGATRVCAAWAAAPALRSLNLADNSIAALSYQELKVTAGAEREVVIKLENNPLRVISVLPSDLAASREDKDQHHAKVQLSVSALQCDCAAALLAALLRAAGAPLRLAPPPPCAPPAAPSSLLEAGPDQLLCACPSAFNFSVSGCSCEKRPLDNATVVRCASIVAGGARWPPSSRADPLALHVANAELAAVPRAALVELHAANNTIADLGSEDISDTLLVLDLRNNSIAHISVKVALWLGAAGLGGAARSVWLSGNPLACECGDRDAIEILIKSAAVRAQLKDWKDLRCRDGRELSALSPSELCQIGLVQTLLTAGTIMLFLLVLTMAMRRWVQPRLKQFLFDQQFFLGWVLRSEHTVDDPNKTHDAFICNAAEDHKVAAKLLRRLEQRGHSAVERRRDWRAGAPRAGHVAASVLCARRTLLLVSDNFAKSPWGLQEFRAARAHAAERRSARVIPVLCGLSSQRLLPEDLRMYLYNNTYLSWDDPDFWEKLWRVMPPVASPPALDQVPLQARPARMPLI